MSRYAATTSVPVDRSRSEIESTLRRYGATSFAYAWSLDKALIQFETQGRRIRFVLPLPDRESIEFCQTPTGRERSPLQAEQMWEQAQRQAWRALSLAIKAKLEAVEAGIATFEDEFLAYTVLPDGSTAGEWIKPQIDSAYSSGQMPPMLPALGPGPP